MVTATKHKNARQQAGWKTPSDSFTQDQSRYIEQMLLESKVLSNYLPHDFKTLKFRIKGRIKVVSKSYLESRFPSAVKKGAVGITLKDKQECYVVEVRRGVSKVEWALHEAIHLLAYPLKGSRFDDIQIKQYGLGNAFMEGATQFITRCILREQGFENVTSAIYKSEMDGFLKRTAVLQWGTRGGLVGNAYFKGKTRELAEAIKKNSLKTSAREFETARVRAATLPRNLKLLNHYILDASCHCIKKMTPDSLNPGFVDSMADELRIDTSLQTELTGLIESKYSKWVQNPHEKKASKNDKIRLALVDLSGAKLYNPAFSGWGSPVAIQGASVPKILPVYAIHQLKFDLEQEIKFRNLFKRNDLLNFFSAEMKAKGIVQKEMPKIDVLFKIMQNTSGGLLILSPSDKLSEQIFQTVASNNNNAASWLIEYVGYPYMASVAWQSGIFHPARGGLWLSTNYGGIKRTSGNIKPSAAAYNQNITALSLVTFYTLLAQGRLVSPENCCQIKSILKNGCLLSLTSQIKGSIYRKCGLWNGYWHDSLLLEDGDIRYAAAILSSDRINPDSLLKEMDEIIRKRNP